MYKVQSYSNLKDGDENHWLITSKMFANPQRDITAEKAAERLKKCSDTHYSID